MPEISIQGTLGAGSTTLYTCPVGKTTKITFIFSNPAAYTLTLSRYDALLGITTDVYSFALSAGDTVMDNKSLYFLKENDYFTLNSSVAGTNYLIYLVEYPA